MYFNISDCMHVASEEGDYLYRKVPHIIPSNLQAGINIVDSSSPMKVCGLYVISEPEKVIEISIKHLDVDCDAGARLGVSYIIHY